MGSALFGELPALLMASANPDAPHDAAALEGEQGAKQRGARGADPRFALEARDGGDAGGWASHVGEDAALVLREAAAHKRYARWSVTLSVWVGERPSDGL